ncbi:hypothetical protein [Acetobacter senegalensis]|uniref:hypothetical protein n=1 Tax=Acetobacter senegalensis TaxID=446692 RepID=UPI0026501877|nr:hypothetical protein [Acetobacter senegalensis]MDN7351763.1 hypothetical protein [Acetobacter senegalensis]
MTVRVTVEPGRVVRDRRGKKCPDTEFSVDEKDFFWAALIRCGDLVRVEKAKPQVAAPAPMPNVAADKKAESK